MLEENLSSLIQETIKKNEIQLTQDEIRDVVNELMPDLDRIISNRVKEHLAMLAKKMYEFFSEGE
jgi:polyhydroxyalkanoate synthesis regulator phasin